MPGGATKQTLPWLPILGYHRVVQVLERGDHSHVSVTARRFESQMRWFARLGYRCISLDTFVQSLEMGLALPPRHFVITFDDGYLETLSVAAPILARFGYVATVFVVTGLVGKTNAWDTGVTPSARLMGWEELTALVEQGFSVGSHTKSHQRLTRLSGQEVWSELTESREALEAKLGVHVHAFCYPWGAWSARVRDLVVKAGYSVACDDVGRTTNDRFALARVDPTYWSPPLTPLVRSKRWYFEVQRQPVLRGLVTRARRLASQT